jgi:hypothetical protein
LQDESSALDGFGAEQLLTVTPSIQDWIPVRAQAPTPQAVMDETKSSSTCPLQSSSTLLQVASLLLIGALAWQLSISCPATQAIAPVAEHAPTAQLLITGATSSSKRPSQSSSLASHVASVVPSGIPGLQLSTTLPSLQLYTPVLAHTPSPQRLAIAT